MAEPDAAVAIVHARGAADSVLLIRRAEREADPWSGHWSFPGGRREPEDGDLLHTALRELRRRMRHRSGAGAPGSGVAAGGGAAQRGTIPAGGAVRVPCGHELPLTLDPQEAVEAVWVPLSVLRDPARHALRPVPGLPPEVRFPAIDLNGVPLWGFTYRLITDWLA
jgi:ADP-ribose pyrophosphatase YjhB (NUDIX family)